MLQEHLHQYAPYTSLNLGMMGHLLQVRQSGNANGGNTDGGQPDFDELVQDAENMGQGTTAEGDDMDDDDIATLMPVRCFKYPFAARLTSLAAAQHANHTEQRPKSLLLWRSQLCTQTTEAKLFRHSVAFCGLTYYRVSKDQGSQILLVARGLSKC